MNYSCCHYSTKYGRALYLLLVYRMVVSVPFTSRCFHLIVHAVVIDARLYKPDLNKQKKNDAISFITAKVSIGRVRENIMK